MLPLSDLRKIIVDMTPTLSGGANGGVRLLAVHLIQHLARLHPECQFTVLTADVSHNDLAVLDAPNVQRHCVLQIAQAIATGQAEGTTLKSRVRRGLQSRLPQSAYTSLKSMWAKIRQASGNHLPAAVSLLSEMQTNLLFCPYGAPTFARPGLPVVSVIVDLQYRTYPQFFTADDLYYRELHFRQACEKATCLVSISDYVRQTIIKNSPFPLEKITTIHITLPQRVQPVSDNKAQAIISRWKLKPEKFVLYPANFWQHKNHETLLEAFASFTRQNPDSELKLVCSGHPDARSVQIQAGAAVLELDERAILTGYVSDEEFAALLQSCRAVIFPSLYEGFGMPVFEAMAFGKPVACSNVTSLPEVAGDAAIFFDPLNIQEITDALSRINTDTALLRNLTIQGPKRATALGNAETMAQKYWQVFEQAAAIHKTNT